MIDNNYIEKINKMQIISFKDGIKLYLVKKKIRIGWQNSISKNWPAWASSEKVNLYCSFSFCNCAS